MQVMRSHKGTARDTHTISPSTPPIHLPQPTSNHERSAAIPSQRAQHAIDCGAAGHVHDRSATLGAIRAPQALPIPHSAVSPSFSSAGISSDLSVATELDADRDSTQLVSIANDPPGFDFNGTTTSHNTGQGLGWGGARRPAPVSTANNPRRVHAQERRRGSAFSARFPELAAAAATGGDVGAAAGASRMAKSEAGSTYATASSPASEEGAGASWYAEADQTQEVLSH